MMCLISPWMTNILAIGKKRGCLNRMGKYENFASVHRDMRSLVRRIGGAWLLIYQFVLYFLILREDQLMTEQEKVTKLKEVFADKAFTEKVLGLETAEDVQAALKDKGIDLSTEEINGIQTDLAKQLEGGEEIGAEQLKNVAGGFIITAGIVGAVASCIGAGAGLTSMVHTVTNRRW